MKLNKTFNIRFPSLPVVGTTWVSIAVYCSVGLTSQRPHRQHWENPPLLENEEIRDGHTIFCFLIVVGVMALLNPSKQ